MFEKHLSFVFQKASNKPDSTGVAAPCQSPSPKSHLPGPDLSAEPPKTKQPKAKRKIMQDPVEKVVKVAKVCQNTTYVIA